MNYAEEEAGFEKVMDLIKAVRTLRADMGLSLIHIWIHKATGLSGG